MSLKPTETWITRARIHARRDIGKEGAHLVPSSVHQHLNLRLACEVFAFGTLVRRLKKGQHCSRDGVFYSNQKTERAATGDFSHTLRPLLPIARLLLLLSIILSPKFVVEPERATLFGDEIYGAVEKRERRTWPRLIKLFCGEIGGGVVGRDKQHVTIWGYFLFHFGVRVEQLQSAFCG